MGNLKTFSKLKKLRTLTMHTSLWNYSSLLEPLSLLNHFWDVPLPVWAALLHLHSFISQSCFQSILFLNQMIDCSVSVTLSRKSIKTKETQDKACVAHAVVGTVFLHSLLWRPCNVHLFDKARVLIFLSYLTLHLFCMHETCHLEYETKWKRRHVAIKFVSTTSLWFDFPLKDGKIINFWSLRKIFWESNLLIVYKIEAGLCTWLCTWNTALGK